MFIYFFHRYRVKVYFLKFLSDFSKLKPVFLSKLFHFHPVCISCDHFISRQEKTASVIADLIGKHGSQGCTYMSCHVRLLDNSRRLQNHVIPKMGTCACLSFSSHCVKLHTLFLLVLTTQTGRWGQTHTCSHLAMSQVGFFVCVRVCLQTLFIKLTHW